MPSDLAAPRFSLVPRSVRGRSRRRLASALVVPALLLAGLGSGASAAELPGGVDQAMVQFRVSPTDGDLTALADALLKDGFDVYGGGAGVLFVHGSTSLEPALRARPDLTVVGQHVFRLSDAPAPASLDDVLPARLDGNGYATYNGGYRTADAYVQFTNDLQAAYPELVKVIKYGETYTEDNDLRVVCVTAGADDGCELSPDVEKARFLFVSHIHARELTTSEMIWRTLTLLSDGYGRNADLTALLDETEIWLVPQINPDGIEHVQRGFGEGGGGGDVWQRKNMHEEQSCSQIGTDLNRNFDTAWGGAGASDWPCDEVYHGASPASEPETFHLQDLMKDLFEDQRGSGSSDPAPDDTRGTVLSLHTYSDLVMFPFGDSRQVPNDAGLRSLAFRMSHYNGYTTGQTDEVLYAVSGSTDDYAYDKLGVAASTFEIGPGGGSCGGFHPPYSCQDGFWNLNRDAFLYMARAAQQPYVMGMGPNVVEAKAKNKGRKAKITATADDGAYGSNGVGRPAAQNVTAGRVFVGTAPWDGGTAKAMKVVGSGTEVELKINLVRVANDDLVWIQARDAAGKWGPTRSVWLRGRN